MANKEDIKFLNQYLKPLHKDSFSKIMSKGKGTIASMALVIIACIMLFYFYAIPPIAEEIASFTPINIEKTIGDNIHQQILSIYSNKIDTPSSKELQSFFKLLNHKSNYSYQFYIINSKEINAFAIPGGKIYVFSGLLDQMDNYKQLSSLLFHEMGHVEKRHTLKNIYRTFSKSLFISLITSDVNAIAAVIVDNANAIIELGYSKELESEADDFSIEQMRKRNIDLEGFVSLFKIINQEQEGYEPPAILSTHPATKDRIKKGEITKKNQKNAMNNIQLQDAFNRIKGFETHINNLK